MPRLYLRGVTVGAPFGAKVEWGGGVGGEFRDEDLRMVHLIILAGGKALDDE